MKLLWHILVLAYSYLPLGIVVVFLWALWVDQKRLVELSEEPIKEPKIIKVNHSSKPTA